MEEESRSQDLELMQQIFEIRMEIEDADTQLERMAAKGHLESQKNAYVAQIEDIFNKIDETKGSETEVEALKQIVEKTKYMKTVLEEVSRKEMELKGILF
jgi:hypothetical protein